MLQVLDDGRLTDGQGRTVDFRNVILILTSNTGSQYLIDMTIPFEERKEQALALVRQQFRPEFLNRLDGMVTFEPLDHAVLTRVADIQIDQLQSRLDDRRITRDVLRHVLNNRKRRHDTFLRRRPMTRDQRHPQSHRNPEERARRSPSVLPTPHGVWG